LALLKAKRGPNGERRYRTVYDCCLINSLVRPVTYDAPSCWDVVRDAARAKGGNGDTVYAKLDMINAFA